jgi:small-conductance mechanosensitive channel
MDTIKNFIRSFLQNPAENPVLSGMLIALVAAVIFYSIVKVTGRFLKKIHAKIESWRGTVIPPVKIQSFEVISADRLTDILKQLIKLVRIAALVAILYLFIPLILGFFPPTRTFIKQYLQYIVAPIYAIAHAIIGFIPNLFFIAVIVIITRYILKFTKTFFNEIKTSHIAFPGFHADWAEPTSKLLRAFIIIFAVVIASPYMPGFGSPAFQGISIFLGVLLSLGSTAAIANIIAGAVLTYMRPFKVGDRVRIADAMGDVVEKTLLVTRVRTVKNVEITIPNAMVLGSHMINFSSQAEEQGLIIHTAVTIGYDAPWRQVHDLLISAARATQYILKDPAPFVLQTGLNDYYVAYELNAYTAHAKELLRIQSELHQNIQDTFNNAGVEIMSPAYTAVRDGNQTAVPEDYLPKTGTPRAFHIFPLGNLKKE